VILEGVDAPALSVVVPAQARPDRLRALLDALAAQDAAPEVVVVADGATAQVERVLADTAPGVRVERHAVARGPAAARNTGWRAATAPLVAFTDDDCVPAPGWATALLAAAHGPDVVVQGRVEPLPAERDRIGPFARTLWVREAGPFFQTANIAYPRALLERLDGFDEDYPHPAGEDTDLGWRAREAGARVVFAPDALVWHAVHDPGWRGVVRDAGRWGTAVRLVERHPGLREHFTHRVFWKPSHERLILAAAGVLLARRTRGVSLAAAVPWLLVHRGEHPSTESLARALPAHLAVDAAEVAAMARGSAEARTLLL
jgi:GT2 family glycosyltransferase